MNGQTRVRGQHSRCVDTIVRAPGVVVRVLPAWATAAYVQPVRAPVQQQHRVADGDSVLRQPRLARSQHGVLGVRAGRLAHQADAHPEPRVALRPDHRAARPGQHPGVVQPEHRVGPGRRSDPAHLQPRPQQLLPALRFCLGCRRRREDRDPGGRQPDLRVGAHPHLHRNRQRYRTGEQPDRVGQWLHVDTLDADGDPIPNRRLSS